MSDKHPQGVDGAIRSVFLRYNNPPLRSVRENDISIENNRAIAGRGVISMTCNDTNANRLSETGTKRLCLVIVMLAQHLEPKRRVEVREEILHIARNLIGFL